MTYLSNSHCASNVQNLSDRQKLEDVIFDMSLFLEDNQEPEVLEWIDTLTSMDLYLDDETSSNCKVVTQKYDRRTNTVKYRLSCGHVVIKPYGDRVFFCDQCGKKCDRP